MLFNPLWDRTVDECALTESAAGHGRELVRFCYCAIHAEDPFDQLLVVCKNFEANDGHIKQRVLCVTYFVVLVTSLVHSVRVQRIFCFPHLAHTFPISIVMEIKVVTEINCGNRAASGLVS